MRILTGGESHGQYETAIIEGFPQGVRIDGDFINRQLQLRQSGAGRGSRMIIEADSVEIVSGLRNKITLGSPVTMLIKNKDHRIFALRPDSQPVLSMPRPAHADLAGALKYGVSDVREILERASARETAARVAVGAVCKQFLMNFDIEIASHTISLGKVVSEKRPENIMDIRSRVKKSQLNCFDEAKEGLMLKEIVKAQDQKDTLGGVVEVWAQGVCPGLGSCMHFDRRLDGKIAGYLMSIPAVKGVEIGLGFEYAACRGSQAHDAIYYEKKRGFFRKTNNSGGIEGGMSNGEPIVARAAMKPIATLMRPLDSVNLTTKKKEKAVVERSDTCAIAACGVIAESMVAIAITEEMLIKFGCDSLKEIKTNYRNYLKTIG